MLHVGEPAVKDCDGVVVDCACTAVSTQLKATMRPSERKVISARWLITNDCAHEVVNGKREGRYRTLSWPSPLVIYERIWPRYLLLQGSIPYRRPGSTWMDVIADLASSSVPDCAFAVAMQVFRSHGHQDTTGLGSSFERARSVFRLQSIVAESRPRSTHCDGVINFDSGPSTVT